MATLEQKEALTRNQELVRRVRTVVIGQALAVLADPGKTNQHDYFKGVMQSKNGGKWLDDLMWEVVRNPAILDKMVHNPQGHTPLAIDQDVEYVLLNAETGVLQKYSVAVAAPVE